MKLLKTMMISGLALNMTFASAQSAKDPIVDQINITQDAVKTAMEEFSQGKFKTPDSYDAEIKMRAFNAAASTALERFEKAVRIRVLQSFSVLVNQYNLAYNNRALGVAREQVLKSLLDQIRSVEADKSFIYREAYLELFSVLPDMPVMLDYKRQSYSTIEYKSYKCTGTFGCKTGYYTYENPVYYSKSGSKLITTVLKDANYGTNSEAVLSYLSEAAKFTRDDAKKLFLEGCYTSTCYFLTQNQITVWKSLIETSLSRDIEIPLADGNRVKITKNVSRIGETWDLLREYLVGIKTEGLINNLPYDVSKERVAVLNQMSAQLDNGSCRNAKRLSETLSQASREGELQASERALFNNQYGKTASCL
jgi:hypothetical protein